MKTYKYSIYEDFPCYFFTRLGIEYVWLETA